MINIGTTIYDLFIHLVEFFTTLYNLGTQQFTIPSAILSVINALSPIEVPAQISVFTLVGVTGAGIALVLSVYYIIKGAL